MDPTYRGRWAWTAVRVLDIGARPVSELLQEKGALDPQLLDLTFDAGESHSGSLVGFLNLVGSVLELNTFAAVRLLDGRRQGGRNSFRGSRHVSFNFGMFALGRHVLLVGGCDKDGSSDFAIAAARSLGELEEVMVELLEFAQETILR